MKRIFKISIILITLIFVINLTSCKKEIEDKNDLVISNLSNDLPIYKVYIYVENELKRVEEVQKNTLIDFEIEGDFLFLGWYDETYEHLLDNTKVTSDISIYAKVIKYGTKFNITYHLDKTAYFKTADYPKTYEFGKTTDLVAPYGGKNKTFDSWILNDEKINQIPSNVYGDIDLYATWLDSGIYHSIKYVAKDVVTYSSEPLEKVLEGEAYHIPYPTRYGYYFRGWYLEPEYINRIYDISEDNKSDVVLYAKFEEATRKNTYVSLVGDSITTYAGYIPVDAPSYYPNNYNFPVEKSYFLQTVNQMGFNLLKNNSYSGSKLSSGTDSLPAAISDKRINELRDQDHDPDIIIVNMGTNDYSHGVYASTFRKQLKNFVKKLRDVYDDVEIYFCLLPPNGYPNNFIKPREEFNQVILEESGPEQSNYHVIDLNACWSQKEYYKYIFSNAHPNVTGFEKMADVIVAYLKQTHYFDD